MCASSAATTTRATALRQTSTMQRGLRAARDARCADRLGRGLVHRLQLHRRALRRRRALGHRSPTSTWLAARRLLVRDEDGLRHQPMANDDDPRYVLRAPCCSETIRHRFIENVKSFWLSRLSRRLGWILGSRPNGLWVPAVFWICTGSSILRWAPCKLHWIASAQIYFNLLRCSRACSDRWWGGFGWRMLRMRRS